MPFLVLKFLHVGAMFIATAMAVGPSVMLYLIARNGEPAAIRRAFAYTNPVFRASGASYGVGILFGVATALTGTIDLTQRWLLTAYALIGVLILTNLLFERWTRRVEASLSDEVRLAATVRERAPLASLAAMIGLTLGIVFVMVVKPNLFG